MASLTADEISEAMKKPNNIRNISLIALSNEQNLDIIDAL